MFSYNSIGKSEASKELTISTEEARTYSSFTSIYTGKAGGLLEVGPTEML